MKQSFPLLTKAGDFAIGFFGWFLISNLVLGLEFYILSKLVTPMIRVLTIPSAIAKGILLLVLMGVPVVTVIVIGMLFFMKRFWFANGIVTAVITNTMAMVLIGFWYLGWILNRALIDWILLGLLCPFPLGIVAFFSIMQS